jgi:poly-gamma-glutamate synthesis protein (capsule biosynthesis protein)
MPAARRLAALLACWLAPCVAAAQTPRDTLRVVAVGDLNLARIVAREYVLAGRGAEIFALVRDRLRAADLALGNLESLILDRGTFADTALSPAFAAPRAAAALLADAGFGFVGAANNHAWDFGRAALLESRAHLDSAGILHAGTGPSPDEALRPAIVRRRGWTLAIFSVTLIFNVPDLTVRGHEAECCIAWADTLGLREAFRRARADGADLVLVMLHAGLEYLAVPPASVVATARGIIHAGADVVFGHHPHVPQGLEWVDGKPIVYSLGNFVFAQRRPWTDRGLWAAYTVFPYGRRTLDLLPVVAGLKPRFATGRDSAEVMRHFRAISDSLASLPRRRARRNVAPPPEVPTGP